MKYILSNAQILKQGRLVDSDVLIDHGNIVSISSRLSEMPDCISIDCSGYVIFPGLIDVHVHLREPGFFYKESIATGSLAAAHGGYTAVCPMPNLSPTPDCPAHLEEELAAIRRDACIHIHPYGTITRGQQGEELADLEEIAQNVVAFSDDGRGVQSPDMMRKAMMVAKKLDKIIAAHCEDNTLLHGGYIHDGEYARLHGHKGICSQSEWGQIERDIQLVRETGCAYHVCHVSTKESVALIRKAKAEGLDITCETAPHYLLLTDMDLQEDGRFKMNPPLRSEADRQALIEGLLDGTIDMIATDHAPHSAEEKSKGLAGSLMGVVGLETAFAKLYTDLVKPGILTLEKLLQLMHDNPSRRFHIGTPLEEGQPADLTAFNLNQSYKIDPAAFLSKGRSTPFAGDTVFGICKFTMVNGRFVWSENTIEK